jgi:TetR/AcrR family transcriptional regulator, transcriptional repressor for nem operon
MDTRNTTRDEIIRVGSQIIGERGFNAAGIDAVLKVAGVPKGSFYHYFPSKEEFGLAVLDQFAREAKDFIDGYLQDASLTPLGRLRKYLEDEVSIVAQDGCKRGCMLGNLSQEMAGQHERFRARLDQIWDGWQRVVARCLSEAQARGELDKKHDVQRLAEFIIMGLEGAIIRAKLMKSGKPVEDFKDVLFDNILK